MQDHSHKQLIIGAGFVGLGMAQSLQDAGIPYDQVDASDDIGGNWHHGVYQTAHIISSKKITQFTQFPMPEDYPNFPSAQNMQEYLQSFASHFGLREVVELQRTVIDVRPVEDNLWQVTFSHGEQRRYKGVLLCNGHHWCQRMPTFQGTFSGEILHSKDYHLPSQLQGKRVLVIGGGNSACDIAAEAARVGATSILSLRESVWFLPKTFAGIPVAEVTQAWMPEWLQRLIMHGIIQLTFGPHRNYGLPTPNYRLFEKHPTLNNEVPYYIQHGRIKVKPAVARLDQNQVHFVDESTEPIDLILCATGYYVAYPFLPQELQRVRGSVVNCYGGSFLADYKGLYFIGWGQARGGVGSLMSGYGPVFARFLMLQDTVSIPLGFVFKELGLGLPTTHLVDPHRIFRQLRMVQWIFPWLKGKAHRLDQKYGPFVNQPLSPLPQASLSKSLQVF